MINIICPSRYKVHKKLIKKLINEIFIKYNLPENLVLNLFFVGKKRMLNVSKKYKSENDALPVLSFKYDEKIEGVNLFGEVIICYPQAILLAAERERKVDDIMSFLIKHGLENLLR